MKLSENTKKILRNFCEINQSLYVKQGNTIRTISGMKNILAEATVPEEFPRDFAIYDLGQFLGGLSSQIYEDPEFDFGKETYLGINDGHTKVKYFYCDPSLITAPPEKSIEMPEVVATFSLNESQWQRIKKAANVYSLPDLVLTGHGTEIRLTAKDKKNDTSNTYSLLVGEGVDVVDFEYSFKMENIRIIDGSYRVEVTANLLSKWTSNSDDLVYYIAMEPDQV
jgi:hypothetical protein|tara:strand:- start:4697 stop:5368 length:672 start_codon:yes stop_codon:yes gene_type:complete